jgi:hypothetical protein
LSRQASCLSAASKKKREIASEVGVERSGTSRSKIERISNKMGQGPRPKKWRPKRGCWGAEVMGKGIVERRENYTLGSCARGLKHCNSFFLLIIGLEGY